MSYQKLKIDYIDLYDRNLFGKCRLANCNREYIMQGICFCDKYYFITAYSNNKNSIIMIYDDDFNYIKTCELYNNAHVGGITYDEKNNIIWITDKNGTISGYSKNEILNKDKIHPIEKYKKVNVGHDLINHKNIPSVAYITYHDNKIYLGNFTALKKGELRCFDINLDGSINLDSKKIISNKFETNAQGIAFYKDFILVSTSYGRVFNSKLIVYKFNNDDLIKYKEYKINFDMSEQLIVKNDKLIIVSESASDFYRGNKGIDLAIININNIL